MENTRGRKAVFADKFAVVEALKNLKEGNTVSRYLTLKLAERGFVEVETVKGEGRGRPRVNYKVTGKGRSYVALSANWKKTA